MGITRALQRFFRQLKANHWVYLLLHLVLLVLGLLLVKAENPLIVGLGGSLIATALAGWVLFLHVWLSQDEFHRLEILRKFGLIDAFEHRAVRIKQEYDARLDHVREAIDIMGFGLRSLREDYHRDFAKWAARAKVRILLLDPEFPSAECSIANKRDIEEKNDIGAINQDVHAFIRECSDLLKSKQSHFEIRLYRCLPSINVFRIDDNLFWGPYLIGDVSRNFPTFLLDQQGSLYKRVLEHFEIIWSSDIFSRPVPTEWFDSDASTRVS